MTVDIVTFGCRLNSYESEVVSRHAAAADLEDVVLVNTCAVTAEAVRQARQTIRRIGRERPGARIVVTGCAAQIESAIPRKCRARPGDICGTQMTKASENRACVSATSWRCGTPRRT